MCMMGAIESRGMRGGCGYCDCCLACSGAALAAAAAVCVCGRPILGPLSMPISVYKFKCH